MTKSVNLTIEGFDGETATVSIPTADATVDSAFDTEVGAVTAGGLVKRSVTAGIATFASGGPYAASVQVDMGLRIYWQDNVTGRKGYFTIPAPDFAALTIAGNEVQLADASVMADLVTEIQTSGASPIDGNPITVTGARIVGRK